ncbi:tRNA pseudouridine(55) synthase TruB [Blautia glucerasea]|uniref:tRNA pseudouridine(55) synthase TruB n=1 Tax=Blautia glucerasea TaxID=536633 RepID=UPI001D012EE9|nr:tRNA pseudouridine(55) synthase TruB [Blautia glucerasea]MCB5388291.1 tRNA pseudouridine(55) synthase TruB [Blautia glucerasea]MCB5422631.1 tRNA pseudouridine(55) synthase TruB [Blautia luti]
MAEFQGIIVIQKEKGFTSHDVVARLRGILHMKKIGHTGTLDPDAVGVLPVALGKGTKLVDLLTDKEKTYEAVLHLGITTDTQDMSGTVLEEKPVSVTEEQVREVLKSFVGEQMQVPPMYSALKVNGKKLYELAREGRTVERKARPVCFYEMEPLEMNLPLVKIRVTCSKGTYIRTLCNDIGEKLGCGGCMEELLRSKVGRYTLEESHTLAQVEAAVADGTIQELIYPVEKVLADYPALSADSYGDRLLANGNPLSDNLVSSQHKEGWVRMYASDGTFTGIFQWDKGKKKYYPVKMF